MACRLESGLVCASDPQRFARHAWCGSLHAMRSTAREVTRSRVKSPSFPDRVAAKRSQLLICRRAAFAPPTSAAGHAPRARSAMAVWTVARHKGIGLNSRALGEERDAVSDGPLVWGIVESMTTAPRPMILGVALTEMKSPGLAKPNRPTLGCLSPFHPANDKSLRVWGTRGRQSLAEVWRRYCCPGPTGSVTT
ncbi:hypothetical protein CALCODRAFT_372827 [Calocera cornea HHB12733]|uniref:Uncharacterized protein n=1 Tax=Calocera cornea HHB12733 TaxID=1353952 RepID=A0A165EFP6_9BASI|nr:hypothetical protein CALCODRAFT_372827 [Calocera cornea HHB12733]